MENQPQQQPADPVQPNQEAVPTDQSTFSPPAPVPPKKSKKKPIIASIALVLLLCAVVAVYYFAVGTSTDEDSVYQSDDQRTLPSAEVEVSGVFGQLDAEFGEYRVEPVDEPTYVSGYDNTYYFFNDEGNFRLAESTNDRRIYQFQVYALADTECGTIYDDYATKYDFVKAIFSEAGYTVSEITPYTQYENCQKAFIAENDIQTCSSKFSTDIDVTGQTEVEPSRQWAFMSLKVNCEARKNLVNDIDEARKLLTMLQQASTQYVLSGDQLVGSVEFKQSQTPGYEIAIFSAPGEQYFYKFNDQWKKIDYGATLLPCVFTGPDAEQERAAFLGERCWFGPGNFSVVE